MYMIIVWSEKGSRIDAVENNDGSIRLFETFGEADNYANQMSNSDDARVISIEAIEE